MTFEATGALVGLLVLPLLVYLHRRRRRVPPVDVPSLIFVEDELESHPPRRRLLDVDLLLALLGAAALALAAAGPRLALGEGERVFRVVVSGGAPATAFASGKDEVLAGLRGAVGGPDRVDVIEVPAREAGKRPTSAILLDVALGGDATWRGVVSDAPPPPSLPAAVRWIRLGRKDLENLGIVRASLVRGAPTLGRDALAVFAMVQASADHEVAFQLVLDGDRSRQVGRIQRVEGGGVVTATLPVPETWRRFQLSLAVGDGSGEAWQDALAADDHVLFERQPLRVALALSVREGPYARVLLDALEAAVGVGGVEVVTEGGDLAVSTVAGEAATPVRGAVELVLFPADDGDALHAETALDVALEDPLITDLSTRGCDLRYAPGALTKDILGGATRVLLWRRGETRQWPVVARRGRQVLFLPDPLAGARPPIEAPLWPLFIDNLRREVAGEGAGDEPGWRRRGLLDPASTDLGRAPTALDEVGRAAEGVAEARALGGMGLRLPLALLGLLSLLLLWVRPVAANLGLKPRRPVPSTP